MNAARRRPRVKAVHLSGFRGRSACGRRAAAGRATLFTRLVTCRACTRFLVSAR